MTKKNTILLAAVFLAVAALYFYLYKDSFRKAGIQISHTIRPNPAALMRRSPDAAAGDNNNMITFRLDRAYKLTEVKVVSIPELATNKYAHPLWELTSDSNSVATPAFAYGMRIRGMHPAVKGAVPSPLLPNVPYRLFLQAGSITGEHDFAITEENHISQ
jgi:hypothetical protein